MPGPYQRSMKMPCLCCDAPVILEAEALARLELPVVLCLDCLRTTPVSLIKVLYIMRSQIAQLHHEVQKHERDMKRMFTAQQELEQEFLKS